MGYSLSFFSRAPWSNDFWDRFTPSLAKRLADRANGAGCRPGPDLLPSEYRHGVPTRWVGPDVPTVIRNLRNQP